MIKGEFKEALMKIIFTIIGVIAGFVFFHIYYVYSGIREILFIVVAIIVIVVIVIIEQIRYSSKFSDEIREITRSVTESDNGRHIIEPKNEKNQEVNKLYNSIEDLRFSLKKKNIIQSAVIDIINTLAVNIELSSLLDVVLPRLVEETNSAWGVFYVYNRNTEKMELKRSIGLSKNVYREFDINIGEGFIGMAALTKEIQIKKDIPDSTIFENRTFLGKVNPKSIMTVPILDKDELIAIIAFASVYEYSSDQIELISILRNYVGFAVANCITYERTQRLTKELQFQNELIQNMNDELEKKVSERTDFLNNIINSINDYLIVSIDQNGYVTTWNTGAEKIRGYKAEETIGKKITNFYGTEEEKRQVRENFKYAYHHGKYSACDWRIRRDRTKYFADIVITPMYNQNKEFQGFTVITKDITAIKNLEQALICEKACNEKIVENSVRALIFTDKDGIILNSNKLSDELLAPDGTNIIGRGLHEFFVNGAEMERDIKSICNTARRGETTRELLYKHDGITKLTVNIMATEKGSETRGMLVYLTKKE